MDVQVVTFFPPFLRIISNTPDFFQTLQPFPLLSTVQSLIVDEKLGNCVPVFVELPADLLTPCAAYLRIAKDSKYSFLLESVASSHADRYCFIGAGKPPLVAFVESRIYSPSPPRSIQGHQDWPRT